MKRSCTSARSLARLWDLQLLTELSPQALLLDTRSRIKHAKTDVSDCLQGPQGLVGPQGTEDSTGPQGPQSFVDLEVSERLYTWQNWPTFDLIQR
jgi:hypothetical protein